MVVDAEVYLTKADVERHGDFSKPERIDCLSQGKWQVMERPVYNIFGFQERPVRVVTCDNIWF